MRTKSLQKCLWILAISLIAVNQTNAYYTRALAADFITSDYIFELIEDCLGEEKFKQILNEEKGRGLFLSYDLNGELALIGTGVIIGIDQKAYFLENEWEQIFDYIHDLPPLPLPNPMKYDYDEHKYYYIDIPNTVTECINHSIGSFDCEWRFRGNFNDYSCPKDQPYSDWFKKNLYTYDFSIRGENPDSLFGKMHWEQLRCGYFDKLNSENMKPKPPRIIRIMAELFKHPGFSWKKIPIKNYTVNLQVPYGSKVKIAPDTLSATVDFPDSTWVVIQYTKGLPYTKIWELEENPRKRIIEEISVDDKSLLSSGHYIDNEEGVQWDRIRFRYGITITMYSKYKHWNIKYWNHDHYRETVLIPATVVLRPKFKNIYLKD